LLILLLVGAGAAADIEPPPPSAFEPPALPTLTFPPTRFSVRDCGAVGDGVANDTAQINRAIAACNGAGGGTVVFPAGIYRVASLRLASNVRLLLQEGAIIRGAKSGYLVPADDGRRRYQDVAHSHFVNAVIFGEDVENVAIEGPGRIDGGGAVNSRCGQGEGDKVIAIRSGRNLRFTNIRHKDGAHFVYLLNDCRGVGIEHVRIDRSRDAVNLVNCRDVVVRNCRFIGCSDDTLAIKSDWALGRMLGGENIYVRDCHFESGANALQFGSETIGDIRNVYFSRITIGRASRAGISITSNDGGTVQDVHYRDITMRNAASPIFMLITRRLRTPKVDAVPGKIRGITFANITASEVIGREGNPAFAATISGLADAPVERIALRNARLTYKGGEDADDISLAGAVPDYTESYRPRALGERPCWGFYTRHAQDLSFHDTTFECEQPSVLPALVFFDVHNLLMERVTIPSPPRAAAAVRLHRVSNYQQRGCDGLPDESHVEIDMAGYSGQLATPLLVLLAALAGLGFRAGAGGAWMVMAWLLRGARILR
jgi:polygalacturonase